MRVYHRDYAILKDYGGIKRKLTLCKFYRESGWETKPKKFRPKGSVNTEKLDCNISRAKSKVFEYAWCNDFKYFITLTIDGKKYDRKNLKAYYKDFSQWLRNYQKKYNCKIMYLFIPELHQDGSWHMHGLIAGIPTDHFTINEHGYLDWLPYRTKFGYVSIDPIRNREACAKYITKYISKNLSDCIKDLNAKMYYCSKGLKTAEVIKKGLLISDMSNPDYEGEHAKIKWYNGNVPLEALKSLFYEG